MALANAVQGARHTGQSITWNRDDSTVQDLTGAVITARIYNPRTGAAVQSDGVFTVVTPAAGVFTWAYGVNDVSAAGQYTVQFKATFGGVYDMTYEAPFNVMPAR